MSLRGHIIAVGLVLVGTIQAQAATTFYTDRAAFEAATSSLTTESFSDGALETGLSVAASVGVVTGGRWLDRQTPAPRNDQTTWSFANSITAFGGDFDLSPGGTGTGLRFTLDGVTELATQLQTYTPTFFGFITDTAFSTLLISAGDDNAPGALAETHTMDNLSFGLAAAPAPVPLPAGLPLLIAGLGGLIWLRRGANFPLPA